MLGLNKSELNLNNYDLQKNVHLYRQGGLNIAYDVNSGSLHLLDDKTYAFLAELTDLQKADPALLENGEKLLNTAGCSLEADEKEEIVQELAELQKADILFSREAEEVNPDYPERPLIKAMCLHVAHDCNLRCHYCFAESGSFGGSRGLMSLDTGKKAIDFLLENSGNRPHCEVDFFGGEPLLNFDVIKELVRYGRQRAEAAGKKIKYTLTTNAVLLNDAVAEYLEQEGISVVLSLDGRPEVNDKMRPFANGKGSYDRIIDNILKFIAKRPNTSRYAIGKYYYVRGTYTHYNTDFYKDVLHLADLGINRISLEPVVAPAEQSYALQPEDLTQIKQSYDILAEKVLEYARNGKEFTFFHFNAGLDDGPCLPKRISGCGAGHEYVAVSPEGDLYPCHQFVGQQKYKLGSLNDSPVALDNEKVQSFRQANIYAKEDCRRCWARFSCSGGCHAANVAHGGELTKIYPFGCEIQKKRLEIAYYLKIKEKMEQTQRFQTVS